jgi:Myb superfamily proteins, including transcription factors and mRNA splicing factors
MVRHFVKGGIWKNSEDEILKAAVMKYGKQQWARVASLLNRKSAKQCKARWNEWLDPSIRKVEWSREEDEKLLHLAKLLPAQWKTIGPLVGGRTSVQCQERYEQLLDEAAMGGGKEEEEEGGGGKISSSVAAEGAGDSVRKLRAGDIDPHPETKPARPDPIDMDDDEIEMLQEARARLANTQGKKAKRKAREKMLNEAKRLADLQKRRELKQAGLLSTSARMRAKRGRREIDYGVEIPFHKPAPAGFHSTAEEDRMADEQRRKRLKQIDFQQINESQYRSRDREEKNAKKREEARLRNLERSNMQYVVAQVSKKNDPISARKRGVLSMPAPSVSDGELEKVAKLAKEHIVESSAMAAVNGSGIGGGENATDTLLGDYTDRPLPTPMRTPMAGSGMSSREVVMREASNLRMLERGQTPLLGELNPTLMEGGAGTGVGLNGRVGSMEGK